MPPRSPVFKLPYWLIFGFSFIVCLCLSQAPWKGTIQPTAQASEMPQLVQQGVNQYRDGQYQAAIATWQTALDRYQKMHNREHAAIVQENLARAYHQIGQSDQAIAHWQSVIQSYRQQRQPQPLGRALTEQAQIYSSVGQPLKAIALLCGEPIEQSAAKWTCAADSAVQIARSVPDAIGEVAALGSLGDAYRLVGRFDDALKTLNQTMKLADTAAATAYQSAIRTSLGNTYSSLAQVDYRRADSLAQRGTSDTITELRQVGQSKDKEALTLLQASLDLTQAENNVSGQVRSLLSAIPLYYRTNQTTTATSSLQRAITLVEQLPDSRDRVYALIDIARLLQPGTASKTFSRAGCLPASVSNQAETLLKHAVEIAQRLQDSRATSFALGDLGYLYECRGDYTTALNVTQSARLAADQSLQAKDSLYLWEWQTGRILKAQGKVTAAIAAYERSLTTLKSIRGDILTATRDIQFDFRDTIEPIYRQLVALRLRQEQTPQTITKLKAVTAKTPPSGSDNLRSVLDTVNELKLAELQDYFGNDCVLVAANQPVDRIANATTAIINTIILDHREQDGTPESGIAVILSLPNGVKKYAWTAIARPQINAQINEFRQGLETFYTQYSPKPAQVVYDWLIRPFAADLQQTQIKTLVFVQDGLLRTVPMAALHDGQQFLIQQYAVVTTPSLSLTASQTLNRQALRLLALGLTREMKVGNNTFKALSYVSEELSSIAAKFPAIEKLVDDDFTRDRLTQALSQNVFPVLHIATHGQFGTDPEDTFIVTGDPKNPKLTFNELDQLIRRVSRNTEPLELLTLTACETAVGDERSALGLAGVAVQAGARSALASLWTIDDRATALFATNLYANLRDPKLSRAEALQAVQKAFIEELKDENGRLAYNHPFYWSPLVLVGNWL